MPVYVSGHYLNPDMQKGKYANVGPKLVFKVS